MTVNILSECVVRVHFQIIELTDFALLALALTLIVDVFLKLCSLTGLEGFTVIEYAVFKDEFVTVLLIMRFPVT